MAVINVISYNVKEINNLVKRRKIFNQLKTLECSAALIQETHWSANEQLKLKRGWVDQIYGASCSDGKKRGVAVLFSKSVPYSTEKIFEDKDGRYIMVIVTIGGIKMTILNVYGPNEDRPSFIKNVTALKAEWAEPYLVCQGS